jgi:hypothetical protein
MEVLGASPTISDVAYDEYAPPPTTSTITVTAADACEGALNYKVVPLDGGDIIGGGAQVDFAAPLDYQFCPYRVRVSAASAYSHITATQIINIYARLPGDANEDGWVNALDMIEIRNNFTQSGDPGWVNADLNCDGLVNVLDLRLVRDYFLVTAP